MASPRTLHRAFDEAAATASGYCFVDGDSERRRAYSGLRDASLRVARALREAGIRRGDLVALVVADAEQFLVALLGTSLSGAIPASLAPPGTTVGLSAYLDRVQAILRVTAARAVVTTRRLAPPLDALLAVARQAFARPPIVLIVDELDAPALEPDYAPTLDDVALVQFTSGSTSAPKGVTLTHANLAANIDGFGGPGGIGISRDDVGVSWLPLSHDMGLVGMALGALYTARPCVLLPPQEFVKHPVRWLRAIARHRGSVSFAPNFAYDLCVRRVSHMAELDLSSWRVAGCGAEPIHASTLAAFAEKFAPAGFRETSYVPCYGLAEHVLAATICAPGRGLQIEHVSADALSAGRVVAPQGDNDRSLAVVSCGRPLPGHRLRVVGEDGGVRDERQVGEIELAGPSVMAGYYNQPAQSAETIRDGWLRSGDLGFVSCGELFVCGRAKDIIIVNGRKYQSEDLEWAVERVDGVRPGRAAVFASPRGGTERVVVVLEPDGTVSAAVLADVVRRAIADLFGLVLDDVVVARNGTVSRTTSGKVQRRAMRDRYERGEFGPARV